MSIQYPFSSIRLVISDVDGTLLDSQHHLREITRDILMKCHEKGLPFTIATGKNWVSTKSLVEKLPIHIPMILANGAIISDPHGATLEIVTIPVEATRRIIEACEQNGRDLAVCVDGKVCVKRVNYNISLLSIYGEPNFREIGDWKNIEGELDKAYKCVVFERDDYHAQLDIEKIFRSKLTDYDLTYCQSTNQIFEVMAPGVTKGSAIHRLCRRMGISTDEVLVFGDGNNDVEMFDNAGISVALANASQSATAHASLIVPSNDCSGPAQLLDYILELKAGSLN